ncbi:MAG: hypothetical protein COB53_03715 [Elusimicrobia bacterium]|nr:MAG: hypothetical protein COB53_03715 [Elusimicrobiota bacterium]
MPSGPRVNYEELARKFRQHLLKGVSNAADACRSLDISQPTFSRVVSRYKSEFLSVGRASKTQYALRREIPGVGQSVVVHQISEQGQTLKLGSLHGIEPKDEFYFESENPERLPSQFFDDLPYFLNDLRPSGFLGRLIPQKHLDLQLPKNIMLWSASDCLHYLTRYGSDLIGNLILGEGAFKKYLQSQSARKSISQEDRHREYPKRAVEVLEYGDPGSSAGGEQPKFSAIVGSVETAVLVKFSSKVETEVGRRVADLLVCEDISLRVLGRAGRKAAKSEIISGNDQFFLEVERFDRMGRCGRRGLVSLETLDAEFVGKGISSWVERCQGLLEKGLIRREDYNEVRWLELYGHMIGNTDMHAANISFFIELPKTVVLAPIYDMLPMLYIPKNDQVVKREFIPPLPRSGDADVWVGAWEAAREFWRIVGGDDRISRGFRLIAEDNLRKLDAQKGLGGLLPG